VCLETRLSLTIISTQSRPMYRPILHISKIWALKQRNIRRL
jgi:hypothetical protein